MAPTRDKTRPPATGTPASAREELPYSIELWQAAEAAGVERVLARALNVHLARAIFQAVRTEHPDRRVTLRKGDRIIADSAG
jgi:hypothetical protein